MESLCGLGLDQNKDNIVALQCLHSKAASHFGGDWDNHWIVGEIEETDESCKVECNLDINFRTTKRRLSVLSSFLKKMVWFLFCSQSVQNKNIHFVFN